MSGRIKYAVAFLLLSFASVFSGGQLEFQTYTESDYEYRLLILGDSARLEWRSIDEETGKIECQTSHFKIRTRNDTLIATQGVDTLSLVDVKDDVMEHFHIKRGIKSLQFLGDTSWTRETFYYPINDEMRRIWKAMSRCSHK